MGALSDLSFLFFPAYCAVCKRSLYSGEEAICTSCVLKLPRTGITEESGNRVEKLFWGRVDVEFAGAFLKMPRRGLVHHLMHQLKYHERKAVGVRLGALYGLELSRSERMKGFDAIIPVPLHPKKYHLRGYNQCDCIAEGMQKTMGIPVLNNYLRRITHNSSQTRKTRYMRWKNVETIFSVNDADALKNKHILLVDDVITTGATIEACAQQLKEIDGLKLSVAAIAIPLR